MPMSTSEEIIAFWFGDLGPSTPDKAGFDTWFGKDRETDQKIREKFEEDIERAGRGDYDHWIKSPEDCLALIILLDQFPRNVYRNSPKAFAHDPKARETSLYGLEKGHDLKLPHFGRLFFYMPFQHSERLDHQRRSLELYETLLESAPPELKDTFRMVMDYARRHHEIISRFGRFPHRNEVLGRDSTREEIEFLKEPGSSF